jgi:rhodanese-related sulfurtransferase
MQAVEARLDLLRRTERGTAEMLSAELTSPDPPFLLDVRTTREWRQKHIDGSVNIPLNQLASRVGELPRRRRLWVQCAGGYRSSIAASLLQAGGFDGIVELAGGLAGWEAGTQPLHGDEAEAVALRPPV